MQVQIGRRELLRLEAWNWFALKEKRLDYTPTVEICLVDCPLVMLSSIQLSVSTLHTHHLSYTFKDNSLV